MRGILTLISSIKDKVFDTPMEISFADMPKIGKGFVFGNVNHGICTTSDVLSIAIDSEKPDYVLKTENSYYKLEVK